MSLLLLIAWHTVTGSAVGWLSSYELGVLFVAVVRCCCEVLDLQAAVALQVRFCCQVLS